MKKHVYFKRTLATFLAVLMLFTQVPVSVFAVETTPEVEVTAPTGDLALGTGVTVTAKSLYSFTPSESGVYCFYSTTTGESDPYACLLDADKKQLAQDDDGGGNLNFEINYALTAGETYYLEADAYSNRFPYTLFVKTSNISSIELVYAPTFEIEEYDARYGTWSTVYNGEIVDRYFRYYPYTAVEEAVLRVNYTDGTSKEIGNIGEEQNFSGISYDWNFSENPWTVGEDNHYYITYKGLKVLANATVTKSPVTSIEVLEITTPEFIEHDEATGSWTNYYQGIELEEEYFEYYSYMASESIKLLVTYEDGTTEEISYFDENEHSTGIRIYSDQYQNPWTLGENEFEIWYRGACTTATAIVTESPVESIEVISGGDYEYIEFDENCGYWMPDENFYYYPERTMQNVVLEVTYKDGSTVNVPYLNEDGSYNGITYSNNQHEVPWTVGGDNEIIISYQGASTTLSAILKPGIVESIIVEDVIVTEGTHGYFMQYDRGEGIDYWYYYEIYPNNITVNLTDGSSITGNMEYIRKMLGYDVRCSAQVDQHYHNQWGPGTYTITASLMGKKTEYTFTIVPSNIESIFVADVELEENIDGNWHTGYWSENGYVDARWFYYEPVFKFQLTVNFTDGTSFTGTASELSAAYDLYPEVLTSQTYANQWQVGGTYLAKAFLCGKFADFSVTIGESNIRSIEVISTNGFTYLENTYGNWENGIFWYSPWYLASNITIRVTYKDGTTEDIPYFDEFGNHSGINYSENQHEVPWTVDGENYLTITYMGAETTVPVIIEASPIESIVVAPMTYTVNTNGYWSVNQYQDENGEWFEVECFNYYINPQLVTITMTDGTVISGTPDEIGMQTGYYPECNAYQSYDDPWGVGDHTATLTFMGITVEYTITIEESPIESITAPDMTFIEGTGGWFNQYTDNEGVTGIYYYYDCHPNQVTITYKDGNVITGSFDQIWELTGYTPELNSYQTYDTPWGVGEHTATVSFMGATGKINVTITPSPVESIVVNPITYTEYTHGDWRMGGEHDEYGNWIELGEYYFYYMYLQEITVNYTDGTSFTGTLDELIDQTGYTVSVNTNQDYHHQWGIGTHTATISFMGKTSDVTVEITASPIASVVVDSVTIEEGTHCHWSGDGNGNYYAYYDVRPQNITVNFSDGSTVSGTYDELWELLNYEINYYTDQSLDNPWTTGSYKASVNVMGCSVEYDVTITECQIESVTVMPHILIANRDGWINSQYFDESIGQWVYGEWYEYNIDPQIITVTFKDGTTQMIDYEGFRTLGYAVKSVSSQSYYNPLQPGTHTATLEGVTFSVDYTIEIIEQITSEETGHVYGVMSDGTAVLIEYNEITNDVVIPETVDGYTVTRLHREFRQYSSVETLTIPSTVKIIDRYAFACDYSLKTLRIYAGLEVIAPYAFYECPNLTKIAFYGDEDQADDVQIFQGNDVLTDVAWKFPNNCTEHVYDDVCDADCNNCFELREPEHAYEWVIDYAGDCLNDGWKHEWCSVCGETRNWDTLIPATGEHINTQWINGYEPTCSQQGYEGQLYCYDCNRTIAYGNSIDPTGIHVNTEIFNAYDATCGYDGYTGDVYCHDCNTYIEDGTTIKATGDHQNTELLGYREATCGSTGYSGDLYCYDCSTKINHGETIPMKDHENTELINVREATCGNTGYTGDMHCNDCGRTFAYGEEIPALEHMNLDIIRDYDATCTEDGYTGDLWCYDCYTTIQPGEVIPATGHQNTELRNKVDASCGQVGYSGDLYCYDCARIVEYGDEIVASEGHANTQMEGAYDATCGKDGYTGNLYCNDCGEIVEYGEAIPATGDHQNTYLEGECDATCGTPGYTGDLICNDCGEVVEYGEVIPANGNHGALSVTGNYEATCNTPGYTGDVMCDDCGATVQPGQVIAATGSHVYDNGYDADCNVCGHVREISQNPPALSLSSGSTYQGSTIRIDVSIQGNTGFAALQFGVLYDSTYLTLVDVESHMDDFYVTVGNSILFDSYVNHVGDGVIATLVFQVAEDAPVGNYNIQLRYMSGSNEDFEEVVMTDSATTIKVQSAVAGDVNGDGKVNTSDLVMLRRYLASMDPTTMVSEVEIKKGADANDDGVVDAIDLAFLRQYLASQSAT